MEVEQVGEMADTTRRGQLAFPKQADDERGGV